MITNGILKEYWGRPRPREVEGLGGQQKFEPVLTYEGESGGKSFPSGHATMGFCLMGGYLLLYRQRKRLALFFLLGGGGGGFLLGFSRMTQGGHFFSDVVWSAIVCWLSSLTVFYGLGLDRKPLLTPASASGLRRSWQQLGIGLGTAALIIGILLGTPYRAKRDYFLTQPDSEGKPIVLDLTFKLGDIVLVPGEKLRIVGEAYGHGVPTSGIRASFVERTDRGQVFASYTERHSGWLAEAKQQLRIEIPWERIARIELETGKADLWISLPEAMEGKRIELRSGRGRVDVNGEGGGGQILRGPDFLGELDRQE